MSELLYCVGRVAVFFVLFTGGDITQEALVEFESE